MTQPRYVVPAATYFITRRCIQRMFRLRPSAEMTQIVIYCLALALHKTGVVLHAACFMSNHHHLVVTDVHGNLPNFLRELHRFIAKAVNASQGECESLWSSESCNVVRLVDAHDVVDKIAYVAANPVAAGLVKSPEEWPGVLLWRECAIRATRPRAYFGRRSRSPESLTLRVAPPQLGWPNETAAGWSRRVRTALAEKLRDAHRAMHSACRRFLGRAAVLARSFVERAQSYEPKRARIPAIAAKDPRSFAAYATLQRAFRAAYRAAVGAWTSGDRATTFPYGTWWMRVHHGAACALGPPAG